MTRNIKKTNLILGLLVIAFFAVSLSFVLDIHTTTVISTRPSIEIIEESHGNTLITHGEEDLSLGCAECHFQPIYGECVDCHIPDYWLGDDDSTYFAHHDLSYSGFMDCWSSSCHNPDPNDVRYVKVDLVEGDDWMEFCEDCHEVMTHHWPKP